MNNDDSSVLITTAPAASDINGQTSPGVAFFALVAINLLRPGPPIKLHKM